MSSHSPRSLRSCRAALSRPLAGFSVFNCFYAAIWLVFLIPPVVALVNSGQPMSLRIYGLALAIAFGIFYGFAFGSQGYYPRGWTPNQRFWGAFAVALALASATYPALGVSAVSFTPYLVAFIAFLRPLKSILRMAPVVMTVSTGFALLHESVITAPGSNPLRVEHWGLLLMWTLATPIFIAVLGVINSREESQRKLALELERSLEREKMATDVHDLLGHSLTIINLKAEVATRYADRDPERAKEEMRSVAEIAKQSLDEVRATVTNKLHRDVATEISRARDALETAGVECTVVASNNVADPKLFAWVLREAVTNIVRHSGATACTITVENTRMVVQDNGRGISASASVVAGSNKVGGGTAGNGLRGMRRRAEVAGAELTITTPESGGTAITVSVPAGRPTPPSTQPGGQP